MKGLTVNTMHRFNNKQQEMHLFHRLYIVKQIYVKPFTTGFDATAYVTSAGKFMGSNYRVIQKCLWACKNNKRWSRSDSTATRTYSVCARLNYFPLLVTLVVLKSAQGRSNYLEPHLRSGISQWSVTTGGRYPCCVEYEICDHSVPVPACNISC
jgi:hypothetical protein